MGYKLAELTRSGLINQEGYVIYVCSCSSEVLPTLIFQLGLLFVLVRASFGRSGQDGDDVLLLCLGTWDVEK